MRGFLRAELERLASRPAAGELLQAVRDRKAATGTRVHPDSLRRLEIAGEISDFEATSSHRNLLQLDLELFPFASFAERVWALRGNLTSYDAWYVALAEELDCPLITLNRRLGRAAGPRCTMRVPPGPGRGANA